MPTRLPKACCLYLPIPVHRFPSPVFPRLILLHELSLILAIFVFLLFEFV